MAVYIVHASLLLIFLGGIVDALYGWRGFLMLTPGTSSNQIELRSGAIENPAFLDPLRRHRRRNLHRRNAEALVVEACDCRCRSRSLAAKKSSSTIRWSIREFASTRPATDAPANSINSF